MGAFLLISSDAGVFDKESALKTISRQCGGEPEHFMLKGWDLYLCRKQKIKAVNYRRGRIADIFATGSPFISGMTYSATLDALLDASEKDLFTYATISGQFFILSRYSDQLQFTTDTWGIYSLYHTTDKGVISSSFLALCSGLPVLTPDREVITENLITGSIVGDDTIFSQIKRFEPAGNVRFKGLDFVRQRSEMPAASFNSRDDSIKGQVKALDEYFEGLKPFVAETGLDSGITGGLDSRLLLALAKRHFDTSLLQFHSHFRNRPNIDFDIGREVCEKLDLKFVSARVKDISSLSEAETEEIFERVMFFNDGQVRTHAFWHEELNTAENRISTLGNKQLGLSGVGGEQYRNLERMIAPSWDFRSWIKYSFVKKPAGNSITVKKYEDALTERLYLKISTRLAIEGHRRLDMLSIKRYMNEIYIPANRGLRAGHENRLSFFLLPFAEPAIAQTAYKAIRYLGLSLNYEAEMINLIDPEIADIRSGYGFSFNKGEPWSLYIPYTAFENLFPGSIKFRLSEVLLNKETHLWKEMGLKNRFIREAIGMVRDLDLPVELLWLVMRKDTGPLVFAMGFLLKSFEGKIKL